LLLEKSRLARHTVTGKIENNLPTKSVKINSRGRGLKTKKKK